MRQITEQHLGRYSIWDRVTQKPLEWLAVLIGLFLGIPPMIFLLVLIFFVYHPFNVIPIFSGVCIFSFLATFLAKKQFLKIDGLFLLFILLAFAGTFSGILGIDLFTSFKLMIGLYFYPFCYLMVITLIDTREKVKWIMRVIILAVTVQAIIGMIELIFGIQLFFDPTVKGSMGTIKIGSVEPVRVSGSWEPTYFGALMVGSIPVTLLMIRLRGEKIVLRVIYVITFALSIMGLISSFSRGAMISFFGLILFGLSKMWGKRIIAIFPILIGLTLGLVVLYFLNFPVITTWIDTTPRLIEDLNPENVNFSHPKALSAAFRWVHVRESLKMIRSYPLFGVGPGNSILQMRRESVHPFYIGQIHNNPLLIAAEYGLFALGLYVCIIFMAWKNYSEVEKVARRNQDEEIAFIAIGLQASLLGFLIAFQAMPIGFNLNLILLCAISGAIKHNILRKEKKVEQRSVFTSDRSLSRA